MDGMGMIGCALMILLLLPILVLQDDGRVVGDRYYGALALGGVAFAGVTQGMAAIGGAIGVGVTCLLLLSAAISAVSMLGGLRLMTGGQIKLIAAGAAWLSVGGAAMMLVITAALFALAAAILRIRKATDPRPDMAGIAAVALLSAQLMT